jgi:hypothetical protein
METCDGYSADLCYVTVVGLLLRRSSVCAAPCLDLLQLDKYVERGFEVKNLLCKKKRR